MWVVVRLGENMLCSRGLFSENVWHLDLEKQRVRARLTPVSFVFKGRWREGE